MSEFLAVHVENALEANEEMLPRLSAGAPPLRALLAFCANFRVAGIGFLFASGTADEFRRRLQQSASAFAHFLPLMSEAAKRGSCSLPLFDAIAVNDTLAAREIATHQRHSWAQGEEYVEDHLYCEYVMQRFFLGADDRTCAAMLDRWELALQGSEDPRLLVCRALQARDAAGFHAGLEGFLHDRSLEFRKLIERDLLSKPEQDTEAKLSVEGLAFVRLAVSLGIATQDDYAGVPSIAREVSPLPFSPDSWRQIE